MTTMTSQITSLTVVYSIVYSDADQRKHQSSASLAFVRGIHQSPVNSPHKGLVSRKMFPFHDVIMRKVTELWYARIFEICHVVETLTKWLSHGKTYKNRSRAIRLLKHFRVYIYTYIYIYIRVIHEKHKVIWNIYMAKQLKFGKGWII